MSVKERGDYDGLDANFGRSRLRYDVVRHLAGFEALARKSGRGSSWRLVNSNVYYWASDVVRAAAHMVGTVANHKILTCR